MGIQHIEEVKMNYVPILINILFIGLTYSDVKFFSISNAFIFDKMQDFFLFRISTRWYRYIPITYIIIGNNNNLVKFQLFKSFRNYVLS